MSSPEQRQATIMAGFRQFLEWWTLSNYFLPKRIRARSHWDHFRAYGIPFVRHFISYEKKGRYRWGGRKGKTVHHHTRLEDYQADRPRYDRFWWFVMKNYSIKKYVRSRNIQAFVFQVQHVLNLEKECNHNHDRLV